MADTNVTIEIEPGLKVRGNRELLSQALANLCDNALKYARPPEDEQSGEESDAKPDAKSAKGKAGKKGKKPVLEIRAAREDGHVRLSVRDNGPGIPVEAHEKVTERFTRLEESRSLPGNGLGLSLVRAVAQLHGGVLEFADAGPGLKADVVLPVAEPV